MSKSWTLIFDTIADRQFQKLQKVIQKRILSFFETIVSAANPRVKALPLSGASHFWRYRIGDYRVICRFEDKDMVIVAVKIGHRKEVYKR